MSLNFFWDLQNQKLVPSLTSTQKLDNFSFYLRDTIPVVLRVLSEQNNAMVPYVATAIDAGKSIKFGAKALATYATDKEFLFSQATWVQSGTGASTIYSADINLNASELIAKMGNSESLSCKCEFTILNGSNQNELSTQFAWTIYKDVITGSEGVPSYEYPVIQQAIDDAGAQIVRIVNAEGVLVGIFKDGAPYTFILSTGLWYPLTGTIKDGIPVPAFGAGESF